LSSLGTLESPPPVALEGPGKPGALVPEAPPCDSKKRDACISIS
jgi:hypothetical protein